MDKQVTLLKYDFGRRVASPFKSDRERLRIKNGMVYTKVGDVVIIPKRSMSIDVLIKIVNHVGFYDDGDNYCIFPMGNHRDSIVNTFDKDKVKLIINGKLYPRIKICDNCSDRLKALVGECPYMNSYTCSKYYETNNLSLKPTDYFRNRAYIKECHCNSFAEKVTSYGSYLAKDGYDFSISNIAKARMRFKERYNKIQIALKLTEIICKGKNCVKYPRCGYKRHGFQHNEVTIDGEPKNNCLMSESDGRGILVEKIKQEYGSLSHFLKLLYYCGRVLKIRSTDGHKRRYIIGFPNPDDTFKCVTDYPPYKNEYTVTLKKIENMVESRPPDLRKYSKSERERIGSVAYAFMHSGGAFYGHSNWFLGIEWCNCLNSHKGRDHIHTISGSSLTQYRYPNSDTLKGVYEIRSYVGDIFNR